MLIGIATTKGSPGATTTALGIALASSHRAIIIEADPDGGTLGPRLGLRFDPGLATLAAAARHELNPAVFTNHLQPIAQATTALLAPSDPRAIRPALGIVEERLVATLRSCTDAIVIIDLGRFDREQAGRSLATQLDAILWTTRPSLEGVDALAVRLSAYPELRDRSALVTIGDGPYHPSECATALSIRLAGHLPRDDGGATVLWRHLVLDPSSRRPLHRAVMSLTNVVETSLNLTVFDEGAPSDNSSDNPRMEIVL